MNEETRKIITEYVENFNKEYENECKIVHIDKSCWYNAVTKLKGYVYDLYFIGYKSSGHSQLITQFKINGKWYKVNNEIQHTNLGGNRETEAVDGSKVVVQDFCSPITPHHILKNPNIAKILKGQLMGQNGNSPMRDIESVKNDEFDCCVLARYGSVLKSKADPISLITRVLSDNETDYINALRDVRYPKNENEVMVKYKSDSHYSLVNVGKFDQDEVSTYYPIITYKDVENILAKIPKKEIDMTVIGLGSAGTGVLDQVCRSTYFNNYLLVDFDKVERKNLRNQWYFRDANCGGYKVEESRKIILDSTARKIRCDIAATRYEEVDFTKFKSKYVVSGFDNLECRLGLLDKVTSGEFECEYLIDLRYLDYTCSIYFIDLKDEKQVKYYRNLLEADIKEFNEVEKEDKYVQTKEQLRDFWMANAFNHRCCIDARFKYLNSVSSCDLHCDGTCNERCMEFLWSKFNEFHYNIPLAEPESSCIRENFIDIYKYSSSFVFAAIREIEGDEPKPFTHIEAQTDVIPTSMVIRK